MLQINVKFLLLAIFLASITNTNVSDRNATCSKIQRRIQNFPEVGTQPGGGGQHTILPNFPKNCMKLNEFVSSGESLAPPLRSADEIYHEVKRQPGILPEQTMFPKNDAFHPNLLSSASTQRFPLSDSSSLYAHPQPLRSANSFILSLKYHQKL